MPPPYPGVDPYIEAQGFWPDFHLKFLNYWAEALADGLPDAYEARLDERVNLLGPDSDEVRLIKPDIALLHRPEQARPRGRDDGGVLVLEPETIPTVRFDEDRQTYLKILHRPDRRVVTILELLSPANKAGESRRDYLTRRNEILNQEVHLVELDLLARGRRVPMGRPLPPGEFHAIVSRWERRPDCEVYSWGLDSPLPGLPVPLRLPDPDVVVDLAAVYRTAFERGRYARSIDYERPVDPPSTKP